MNLFRLAILALALAACDSETATTVVLDNQYPAATNRTVYRAWWETTYFDQPVAAGTSSKELRSVPATNFAYVLIAPSWDASSAAAPTVFSAMKSKQLFSVTRSADLRIGVSDATFFGSCDAKEPLSAEDATFIGERIFPGELANMKYDPTTCTFVPATGADADAGP